MNQSILNYNKLYDANGNKIFIIDDVKIYKKNTVIASILNISTKNSAEKLLEKIYINKEELKP